MRIKAIEIRDRMTFIPAIIISMEPSNASQGYLPQENWVHGRD